LSKFTIRALNEIYGYSKPSITRWAAARGFDDKFAAAAVISKFLKTHRL